MGKNESRTTVFGLNALHQVAKVTTLLAFPPPRGLGREIAAAYIGVGSTKFDQMVKDGAMPRPRIHGARRLWDRSELDIAFSNLPHVGDDQDSHNPWLDVIE